MEYIYIYLSQDKKRFYNGLTSIDAGYDTKCDCTSSLFGCPARMSCEKNIKCVDKETCGIMGTSSCVGVCL